MKQGGKRNGAGRKPALYDTKIVSFRVDVTKADKFKTEAQKLLNKLNSNLLIEILE